MNIHTKLEKLTVIKNLPCHIKYETNHTPSSVKGQAISKSIEGKNL